VVATEDLKLGAAQLDDEVEKPVKCFSHPPASGGSFVGDGIVSNFDIVEEGVYDIVLDGDDSLDNESKRGYDGERVLGDVDESQSKVSVVLLPIALEHSPTEEEQKRLAEDEGDSDDGEAAAVNDTFRKLEATHHDRRNRHPFRYMEKRSREESADCDDDTSKDDIRRIHNGENGKNSQKRTSHLCIL